MGGVILNDHTLVFRACLNNHIAMSHSFSPELILIDLDGTLVDSIPDISWCLDETMQLIGLPKRGESSAKEWVGNGVIRVVQSAIANDLNAPHDKALFEKAMPIFRQLYTENSSKRSVLYDGVRQGLDYLQTLKRNRELKISCVTNKDEQFTHPILREFGIWNNFEIILCGDILAKKKPDPLPLLHAANELGFDPKKSLMIGDSISDVRAARAAGFNIICMPYGYNHGDDIRNSQPGAVIDSMLDLQSLIH